jgi:hypothetical protein
MLLLRLAAAAVAAAEAAAAYNSVVSAKPMCLPSSSCMHLVRLADVKTLS